jgi:hypothetical protein
MQVKGIDTANYKVMNGTYYKTSTPDSVIRILENARLNNTRLKIYYGDTATGRDWMEENDTIGTIGRSGGQVQIPLLIRYKNSYGGGGILDHCIVKVRDQKTKVVLYQAANYHQPQIVITPGDLPEYPFNIVAGGSGIYSRHKSHISAIRLLNKLL